MNIQFFFITLFGFGALVIILFVLDIYFLIKTFKHEKKEKDFMSFKFYETIMPELEKMINLRTEKTISKINQKIADEIIKSHKEQIAVFSERIKNKIDGWDEISKKNENLMIDEAKKRTDELSKGLDERIGQFYRTAAKSISQKIIQSEKNIENYKNEKLKETDQKIYQIIGNVAKKTIGKSIDLSSHEELVMQALEKAKKEMF